MTKCPWCTTKKTHDNCQRCFLAEKARREQLVADIRELVASRPYYKVAEDVAQRLRIEEEDAG
jgi:hypothetical protein